MTTLADNLAALESALADAGLGLVMLDKLTVLGAGDEHIHKGCVVRIPSSANTDGHRNFDLSLSEDMIEVEVAYKIRPREQRTSRDEALVLEAQIRDLLTSTDAPWSWRIVWRSSDRAVTDGDSTKLVITQTFATLWSIAMGG